MLDYCLLAWLLLIRTFNPENTNQLDASTGKFTLPKNYFNENEELIYTAKSTFAGISPTNLTYKNGTLEDALNVMSLIEKIYKKSI